MDLVRHLRYFVAVAEELHFGRAAERLGMAQPPLSQRIRKLESELAATLFERGSRGVRLTDAGRVLLGEATDILARLDRAVMLTRKAHLGQIGALRAGVPSDMSGRALAAIANHVACARPDLRLDLQEITTEEQLRLLDERSLDVGLVQQPVALEGFEAVSVRETRLGVVLPRDSPLAGRGELTLPDLTGHGLVIFPRAAATGYYDAIVSACRQGGFDPVAAHHASNPEFVLGLVLSGNGVAFDTGTIARKETRAVWRPVSGNGPVSRLSVVWPSRHRHPAAEVFATAVEAALSETAALTPATTTSPHQRPWSAVFGYTS